MIHRCVHVVIHVQFIQSKYIDDVCVYYPILGGWGINTFVVNRVYSTVLKISRPEHLLEVFKCHSSYSVRYSNMVTVLSVPFKWTAIYVQLNLFWLVLSLKLGTRLHDRLPKLYLCKSVNVISRRMSAMRGGSTSNAEVRQTSTISAMNARRRSSADIAPITQDNIRALAQRRRASLAKTSHERTEMKWTKFVFV